MKAREFLNKVAYIGDSSIPDDDGRVYYSKFDDSYITRVGLEDDSLIKFLAEHEITDELTHGVGFSPKEQKWYGWSHRAIYGFGIGSEVDSPDHCCATSGYTEEWLAENEDPNVLPVGFKAETMGDAKRMAVAFNSSVS